jgi:hypothetical protein
MSFSNWPGTLPQKPNQSGYKEGRSNNVLATQMDTGPAKRRMRATTAPRPISFQMRLTATQVVTFNTFFDSTTHSGTDSFYFPLPPSWALTLVHFTPGNVPSMVPSGDEMIATINIEVDP